MTDDRSENPGCLLAFLNFFKSNRAGKAGEKSLPYRTRDDFLSPAEASFCHVLSSVVKDQAVVCLKVRLGDVFFVAKTEKRQAYANRISAKHVDFLLCDSKTMKPLAGIELDDASHNRADREERDEFVEKVFQAAGLPLVRVKAQREYNVRDLATQVLPLLTRPSVPPTAPLRPAAASSQSPAPMASATKAVPICPKCGVQMVMRVRKHGPNPGSRFYGCPNFPKCREVQPSD